MAQLELIVDANPLISSLLGGHAFELIFSDLLLLVTTERTTWEVKRYIPMISDRSGVSEEEVLSTFELFPLAAYQSASYAAFMPRATSQIGRRDPKDIDILALTYFLGAPLWTQDPDLREIEDIQTVTTQELLALIQNE